MTAKPPLSPLLRDALVPVGLAYLVYFLRFGYDFGHSDQDELLPLLLHRLDPALYASDWFIQTQAPLFHVRTYMLAFLEALVHVGSVPLAIHVLYGASWVLISTAVYLIARHVSEPQASGLNVHGSHLAAGGATVLILALTPQWTLGGNDLIHRMFVPSMLAWGLALWGIAGVLRGRYGWGGLLVGIAAWFQVLVGVQTGLVLGCVLLWRMARKKARSSSFRNLVIFGACSVLAALPIVVPLFIQQYGATTVPTDGPATDPIYILAYFRAPHHYLPLAFADRSILRFGLLVALGGLALAVPRTRRLLRGAPFAWRVLGVVTVGCCLAFGLTTLFQSSLVIKLQLFKLTVLAKIMLVAALSGVAVHVFPQYMLETLTRWSRHLVALVVVLIAGFACLGAYIADASWIGDRLHHRAHATTPQAAMEAWIRAETPRDALFAAPLSYSGFRYRTQRAAVVSFKSFPFQDTTMVQWMERVQTFAPVGYPARTTAELLRRLDDAYHALPHVPLDAAADRYGVTYLVREKPSDAPGWALRFDTTGWFVYERMPNPLP